MIAEVGELGPPHHNQSTALARLAQCRGWVSTSRRPDVLICETGQTLETAETGETGSTDRRLDSGDWTDRIDRGLTRGRVGCREVVLFRGKVRAESRYLSVHARPLRVSSLASTAPSVALLSTPASHAGGGAGASGSRGGSPEARPAAPLPSTVSAGYSLGAIKDYADPADPGRARD